MSVTHPSPQGKTASDARAANLATLLREISRASDPLSRADLAARLGVTRSTVSRLIDELIAGGFVVEGEARNHGRGRPSVPLSIAPATIATIGIEVNVDRIVLSVLDLTGDELASQVTDVDCVGLGPDRGFSLVAANAEALLMSLPKTARVSGAHLAVSGLVNEAGDRILRAPNLRWDGSVPREDLAPFLERHGLSLTVGNDINAAALTLVDEANCTREHAASFIYLTGEVGIGSAIVLNGQVLSGEQGWAGELGHVMVDPQGAKCRCGSRGCLETAVGLQALLAQFGAESVREIAALLRAEDAEAISKLEHLGGILGQGIAKALNVVNVSTVILGGYLGELFVWLEPILLEQLQKRVMWARYSPIVLRVASHSTTRAASGAALFAMKPIKDNPAGWLLPAP